MAEPTRGMVAGQPIKTGDLTADYESGFNRIFGEDRPASSSRGRVWWNPETKKIEPYTGQAVSRVPVVGDAHYDGLKATDGTPIDTRKRHRDYMKANNLTLADDYKGQWARQAKERREGTPAQRRERKEDVARTVYQLSQEKARARAERHRDRQHRTREFGSEG